MVNEIFYGMSMQMIGHRRCVVVIDLHRMGTIEEQCRDDLLPEKIIPLCIFDRVRLQGFIDCVELIWT